MSLLATIKQDLTTALKSRDEMRVTTLRMLTSSIHNEEIAKGGELSDDDIQSVVKREAKKRKEAIDSFKSAGRDEQAQKEADELKILEAYLPEMMSEEEISKIVEEEISNSPDANAGQIIGAVMKRAAGSADGGMVGRIVNQKISGK